jgi:hypothetical protein
MRESSPPTAETADDNPGQWDILVNGESIQEKDDVTMAKHNGDEGCLIAATSNKAAREPSGGGAPDGAEAARPNRCLRVQYNASIFLHWRSID